jgi:hypothetical protein
MRSKIPHRALMAMVFEWPNAIDHLSRFTQEIMRGNITDTFENKVTAEKSSSPDDSSASRTNNPSVRTPAPNTNQLVSLSLHTR